MKNIPNVNYVTKNDLCLGCGICQGSCPFNAIKIGIKKGCFRPEINSELCRNKLGCHRCFSTCPGIEINFKDLNSKISKDEKKINNLIGNYIKCYTGYSNDYDIRYHAASGGLVTQTLIYLLRNKIIDGAVVTRFDKNSPLLVNSFIATTEEEVLSAKSSKYSPVNFSNIVSEIKKTSGNKFVIVGLPCHIEGLRKYELYDKKFKDKILGYFGLLCSSSRSFYLTEYICKERGFKVSELESFAYRDNGCLGNMVAQYKKNGILNKIEESFESYYQSLASFFVPTRCKLCIDHYAELADVSFGDIHIKPYSEDKIGTSSLIVRTHFWNEIFLKMNKEGIISLKEVDIKVLNASQPMAEVKKTRNLIFCKIRDWLGKQSPRYHDVTYQNVNLKFIKWYLFSSIQHFIGFNKIMWWIIPIIKKITK